MKNIVVSLTLLILSITAYGQSNAVEQMFEKYADKEGFTLVSISSKMFSLLSNLNSGNEKADNIINNLSSIKILSVSDSILNKNLNFYSELYKKLDPKAYEELMIVKEGKDITRFLVKYKGDRIAELLVISGGPGGNSIISITGNLSIKNISDLSKSMDIGELDQLKRLEKER